MKGHTDYRYFLFKKNPSKNPNCNIVGFWYDRHKLFFFHIHMLKEHIIYQY